MKTYCFSAHTCDPSTPDVVQENQEVGGWSEISQRVNSLCLYEKGGL